MIRDISIAGFKAMSFEPSFDLLLRPSRQGRDRREEQPAALSKKQRSLKKYLYPLNCDSLRSACADCLSVPQLCAFFDIVLADNLLTFAHSNLVRFSRFLRLYHRKGTEELFWCTNLTTPYISDFFRGGKTEFWNCCVFADRGFCPDYYACLWAL